MFTKKYTSTGMMIMTVHRNGFTYIESKPLETSDFASRYCPAAITPKLKIKTNIKFKLNFLLISLTIFFGEYPKLFLIETSSCFSKN